MRTSAQHQPPLPRLFRQAPTYGPAGPRTDLVQLLQERGWSQIDLAREAGVGRETVRRVMLGHYPRPRVLEAIAKALDVPWTVIRPINTMIPGVNNGR